MSLLFFFLLALPYDNCQGCCSSHGGVDCVNGVTLCGDGTPLSRTCREKGCNGCDKSNTPGANRPPSRPDFLEQGDFGWDPEGDLHCYFPHPNSDGRNPNATGYRLTLRSNCGILLGFSDIEIIADTWPVVFEIQGAQLPSDFTIHIRRTTDAATSQEWVLSSPARPQTAATSVQEQNRFLLHIPKRAAGFAGQLKLVNRSTEHSTELKLHAYAASGTLLVSETIPLAPATTRYATLYDDLFQGQLDQISHIAIEDPTQLAEVLLGYKQLESGFTVWQHETSLTSDPVMGKTIALETSGAANAAVGVAVLNLREDHSIGLLLSLYDQAGQRLGELSLGTLPSGGKVLFNLATTTTDPRVASYRLSASEGESIQVLGLVFSGTFFAPAITSIVD